jgi:predicted nucleic acid-binding protein
VTVAILDTTVMVHLFRKYQPALDWLDQELAFSITSITWMEVMVGVANKRAQADLIRLLGGFNLIYLTQADQVWAIQQVERLRFSHSVGMNDAMIAAVAQRLQLPLYTHNLKDMTPLIGELAIKPYP